MVEAALKSHQSELVAHGCCAEKSTREAGQAVTFPWCDFSSLQRFALNLPVATKSPVPIFFSHLLYLPNSISMLVLVYLGSDVFTTLGLALGPAKAMLILKTLAQCL